MIKRGIVVVLMLALLLPAFGCANGDVGGSPAEEGKASEPIAGGNVGGSPAEGGKASEPTAVVPSFEAKSPVSTFSKEDIDYLGIACSGSDTEIAECIEKWQENNMIYAGPSTSYVDFSDPIRWNYFLPGIFPSREIIYERVDNGKVYGVCFDYAIVYCSIAEYYGLKCRVMNSKSKPSETANDNQLTTGMSPEEYNRLKVKLDKNNAGYPYEAVNLVAEETPSHYWVEVYLNGEWVIEDATSKVTGGNTQDTFYATNDFEVTDWMSRDNTALLRDYTQRLAQGEDLEALAPSSPGEDSAEPYQGITDDLGQSGRAANIDDLMQGLGLAPYFNEAEDARDFVRAGDAITETDLKEAMEDKEAYESCSGKKLYLVCYFICDGDELEGTAWVERYEALCGEKLDPQCMQQCIGD